MSRYDGDPSADDCVRAGMYWFGRSDLEAARAWWDRAIDLDPKHTRARECLRLLDKTTRTGFVEEVAAPSASSESIHPEAPADPSLSPQANVASPMQAWTPSPSRARMSAPPIGSLAPEGPPPIVERTGLTDTLVPLSAPEAVLPPPAIVRPIGAPPIVASKPVAPLSDPAEAAEEQVSQGWSSNDLVPSGDLASIDGPVDPDDPFAFAADAPPVLSASSIPPTDASPWDQGPSRTEVVTVGHDHPGFDAVAEPTPLPTMDRGRFFGRPAPETKEEIEEYLRATGDLPPASVASIGVPTDDLLSTEEHRQEPPLAMAKQRYQLHDFAGAIEWADKIDGEDEGYEEARELVVQAERELTRMYESKIADFDHFPQLKVASEELIWLNLNHRSGFILSQIDGTVSYEDLIALSGMARLDTLKILAELIQEGVIG